MLNDLVDKRIEDDYYNADDNDMAENQARKTDLVAFMKGLDADLEKEALIDAWKNRQDELSRIL